MTADDLQYWISEVAQARADVNAARTNRELAMIALENRTRDLNRAEAALAAQLEREIDNA